MKEMIQNLSAILTPLIAIIVTYIAYQQYKTSRNKLKWDLYDKRFHIYNSLMDALSESVTTGNISNEKLFLLGRVTNESKFLFDEEMYKYIRGIWNKACELQGINMKLNQKNSSMLCIGVDVLCHSRKRSASGILLWKDSGQAGMTNV